MFNLSEKRILVTGASAGIGRGISIALSSQGAKIFLTGRNKEKLLESKQLLSDNGHNALQADLAINAEIIQLVSEIDALDGLVLNAGYVKTLPIKFVNEQDLSSIFQTNVFSNFFLVKELIRQKKLNKAASVCLISSIAADKPTPANSMYAASKGAINSFCKALALELAPKGIRVNSVMPGMIQTNILENSSISEEQLQLHSKNYPLGRFGTVEDVSALIVYLMSSESSWMTGSLIPLDGGFSLK
jgi:NAD(P)-dependent dehydrogenase (short-subunit alcohol dehydrogenase family)